MKFLKQKVPTKFGIFSILFFVFVGIAIVWKPWGRIILFGVCGICSLPLAIMCWKAKMPYIATAYTIGILVCLMYILTLSLNWFPLFFITFILHPIERKKHPDKIEKWEKWRKSALFSDVFLCKYKG